MTAQWTPATQEGQMPEDLSLSEWIGQAIGRASTCWSNIQGAGVFDSSTANVVHQSLHDHIHRVIDEVIKAATPVQEEVEPFEVWSRRQIEKFGRIINDELFRRVDWLETKVKQAEKTDWFTEDSTLGRWMERVRKLEQLALSYDKRVKTAENDIEAIQDQQDMVADNSMAFNDRLKQLEAEIEGLRGRVITEQDRELKFRNMFQQEPAPLDAVGMVQINQAEERVRQYMKNHFSEGTISGVLMALRGDPVTSGTDWSGITGRTQY